jgi:bacillithiol biosynthesis cysteine-adding enzyme BshC
MSNAVGFLTPEQTGQFSPLILDYLNGKETLSRFISYPCSPDGYGEAIRHRNYNETHRRILVAEMEKQYRQLNLWEGEASAAVRENLTALGQAGTYTVTTGHQLNVFTGPLYTIYKILTTIRTAETLRETYPQHKVVPVFWLATEDHDFAEINHIHLFGKKLEWAYPTDEEAQPVGRLPLNHFETVLKQLEELRIPADVLAVFKQPYTTYTNLADATFAIYHHLFARYGLLILQPDSANLKKLFIPYISRDVFEKVTHKEVSKSITVLQQLGYKIQVNPREINHFYLTEKDKRERILGENNYRINNTDITFSAEEVRMQLEAHPERFSPNVLMRPVYQEVLLPNVGYVGGPGEIAYWLELKGLFEALQIPFPVLHLRNSFITVGEKVLKQIEATGLKLADFFLDEPDLVDLFLKRSGEEFSVAEEIEQINALLEVFTSKMEHVDKSKVGAWVKRINEQKAVIKKLNKEFVDIVKERNDNQIDKLIKIRHMLLPEGVLGERSENVLSKAKTDVSAFINEMYDYTHPFSRSVACVKI